MTEGITILTSRSTKGRGLCCGVWDRASFMVFGLSPGLVSAVANLIRSHSMGESHFRSQMPADAEAAKSPRQRRRSTGGSVHRLRPLLISGPPDQAVHAAAALPGLR